MIPRRYSLRYRYQLYRANFKKQFKMFSLQWNTKCKEKELLYVDLYTDYIQFDIKYILQFIFITVFHRACIYKNASKVFLYT